MSKNDSNNLAHFRSVSQFEPCPHCGKPDWCYFIGKLSVCKRAAPPATGWKAISRQDGEGTPYYAPIEEEKASRPSQRRIWEYPSREGSPLVRVVRIDDGTSKKKIWQESWNGEAWVKGTEGVRRKDIPIYRYEFIRKAIAEGQEIFVVEGEPCADALIALGLAATTNIGGSGKWQRADSEDLEGASVVICPDRDEPGVKHALSVAKDFPNAQWLYAFPDSPVWDNLPKSGGLDVADWISDYRLTAEHIRGGVTGQLLPSNYSIPFSPACEKNVVYVIPEVYGPETFLIPDAAPPAEEIYTQKVEAALYSGEQWVAVGGVLHKWVGTHYQIQCEETEQRRIADFLATYAEFVKGKYKYNRANSASINAAWEWVVRRKGVSPKNINPPGLNCKNGVLRIRWVISIKSNYPMAEWELYPHNPEEIYTYVSDIAYNPGAESVDCDRLLECLEPAQRKIFLQTVAAALDLPTIRQYRGRMVKMLLCSGSGSNGKDALRSALACVLGTGMSGATLSDFQAYDQGRKFSLVKLEGSLCNWASENTSFMTLDNIQSIKQFGTGDPLDIERKGVDSYEFVPNAIGLFNCNEAPAIRGGLEAIQSRWAVLSFKKTFKTGADPNKEEIEADPRFKYDPTFIRTRVAPALLNKMLETLATLIRDGIDFDATREAFQEIQENSCHLWQFVREAGIEYQSGGRIYINDLWQQLKEWYVATGVLEVEVNDKGREKFIWQEMANKYDGPVKANNQIFARFKQLFPKIERARHTEQSLERKGQFYLKDVKVKLIDEIASPPSPPTPERIVASPLLHHPMFGEAIGEAIGEATTLTQCGGEGGEAILPKLLQVCSKLSVGERDQLVKALLKMGDGQPSLKLGDVQPLDSVQKQKPLPAWASLKPGDKVRYVGQKFACLYTTVVTINRMDFVYGVADAKRSDGSYTDWVPFEDWEKVVE